MIALAIVAAVFGLLAGVSIGVALALLQVHRHDLVEIDSLRDRLQSHSLSEYRVHHPVAVPAWDTDEQEYRHSATGSGLIIEPVE